MAYSSIEELINSVSSFEEKLTDYYASMRDQTENNGVKLLTYYLSRHRNHLNKAMEDLDKEDIKRIKKIKIKYDIEFEMGKDFPLLKKPPKEIVSKELLESAVEYDLQIIDLYKKIIQQSLPGEAKLFFENCIKIEEKDIVMLKKMIAMNYF